MRLHNLKSISNIKEIIIVTYDRIKYFRYKRYIKNNLKFSFNCCNKKILLITNDCENQGAPILLKDIANTLVECGNEVTILSRRYGPLIIKLSDVGRIFVFHSMVKFRRIVKKLTKQGYNKAICNTTVNGDLVKILKQNGFQVISLVHELPLAIKSLHMENKALELANNSDVVVFPSYYVYNKFLSITTVTSRYIIKPQGIVITDKSIHNKRHAKAILNKNYEIPLSNHIIINVGFGTKRKGYDLFLKMVYLCKNTDITFVWVGNYQQRLYQDSLDNFGICKFKNLVQPGFMDSNEALANFYDAADLMALTSREDPFPSVVLQAFHYHTPVVAFKDAGGFEDIVINDKTGYLVEYENYEKLLNVIETLIFDDRLLSHLSKNCRKLSETYNFKDYVDSIMNEFFIAE